MSFSDDAEAFISPPQAFFGGGGSSNLLWACAAEGATRWGSPTAARTPSGTWGLRWGTWERHFPVQRNKNTKEERYVVHFCHLLEEAGIAPAAEEVTFDASKYKERNDKKYPLIKEEKWK